MSAKKPWRRASMRTKNNFQPCGMCGLNHNHAAARTVPSCPRLRQVWREEPRRQTRSRNQQGHVSRCLTTRAFHTQRGHLQESRVLWVPLIYVLRQPLLPLCSFARVLPGLLHPAGEPNHMWRRQTVLVEQDHAVAFCWRAQSTPASGLPPPGYWYPEKAHGHPADGTVQAIRQQFPRCFDFRVIVTFHPEVETLSALLNALAQYSCRTGSISPIR